MACTHLCPYATGQTSGPASLQGGCRITGPGKWGGTWILLTRTFWATKASSQKAVPHQRGGERCCILFPVSVLGTKHLPRCFLAALALPVHRGRPQGPNHWLSGGCSIRSFRHSRWFAHLPPSPQELGLNRGKLSSLSLRACGNSYAWKETMRCTNWYLISYEGRHL